MNKNDDSKTNSVMAKIRTCKQIMASFSTKFNKTKQSYPFYLYARLILQSDWFEKKKRIRNIPINL